MIEENLHHRIYPAFSTNWKNFAQQHSQIPDNPLLLPALPLHFQLQVFDYSSDTRNLNYTDRKWKPFNYFKEQLRATKEAGMN